MDERPGILIPSLVGGGVMAILSWLPIVNMGNCLCCMWILIGGGLGVYVHWRQLPPEMELTQGEAAKVGLVSGIFGALFYSLLTYFVLALTGSNPGQGILESVFSNSDDIPVEIEAWLRNIQEEGVSSFFMFAGMLFNLVLDSIFGVLGGIIAQAILVKRQKNTPVLNK